MKVKTKMALGTTVLFLLILAIGITGPLFIHRLADESGEIIKNNYASLEYCHKMQKALNTMHSLNSINVHQRNSQSIDKIQKAQKEFELELSKEENNITEQGESKAVVQVRTTYQNYLNLFKGKYDVNEFENEFLDVHNAIIEVLRINMNAMNSKNIMANKTADKAILYVSIVGFTAFILSFILLLNFPGYIADPLIDITQKITEISKKHYDQRLVYPGRADEIGILANAFNKMASKLQEFEKSSIAELRTEKSRIDSIVKNLNEGIILLDEDKNIKVVNPVAIELLDLSPEKVLEKYAPDIAMQNDLFRELIKEIDGDTSYKGKPLRITINEEENFFQKNIFVVYRNNPETNNKEIAGYIISLRNITEFKKLDLAKTNFIAVVSHELKTPISSISLSLKLLQDERVGSLNEEQKKLLGSLKDETTRLSKITGELLDISQVETGHIRLTIEEVSPLDIINFSEIVIKPHVKEKDVKIIHEISNDISKVKADLEKTVWVMTNLLVNAVRYSPEGGKIKINVHPSLKDMIFSVEDEGQGIDPRNKEKIFQRFVQVDNKGKREGVGLGLAISKEFIQEQNGKIWVESELGVGSKFVFTLPLV